MKLFKLASEQEFVPEDEQAARQAIWQEQGLQQYHTADILEKLTPLFKKRIDSNYIADGARAIFEYDDGQLYELEVSPYRGRTPPTAKQDPNDDIRM